MVQEEQGWRTAAWVWFPDLVSHVGWVCCWFSSLLKGFKFLWVFWFSSLRRKKTNKQAKNKKTIQIRPGSRGKKNHLVEWPLLNSHSLPIIPVVFRVVCTNSASSSIQMVERRATIKEVEGLGLRPDLHQGSKDLNDRGEFIANYLTFNSSLVRTPNRGVVSCTFAVMACPLQTVEHQVLGDVICRLFTGVAQKIFFVPLPLKYISKRKLAINQKVN